MPNKKVYFVRHGEAEGNTLNFFQFPETRLTESGHKGAMAVADRLRHLEVDELIVSPFVRTQETAQYISDALDIPFVTLNAFHEVQHAEVVRGKKFDSEEGHAYIETYLQNFCDINWHPQGAENYHDVLVRAQEGIEFLEQS